MEKINNTLSKYKNSKLELLLKQNYMRAMKDVDFKNLVSNFKLDQDTIIKNTSKLKKCCSNLENCKKCKSIATCKNEIAGYYYYPEIKNDILTFKYRACKYKKNILKTEEELKNVYTYSEPGDIVKAKMKDLYIDDKSRYPVIKYLKNFIDNYGNNKVKGVYLHGNFGCGKTYMVSACINELSKKGVRSSIVYWPDYLRILKNSFGKPKELSNFDELFEKIQDVPILLIDDIGAEATTTWARDEILSTVLQYRMQNNLTTFFTSNLTIDELENHLSITKENVDKVKARRIIERIKYLTEDMELISENRRK